MPHEPLAFGPFEIVTLCDGWAALPLAEEVPGENVDWDAERRRYPWAFPTDGGEGWAWHVHAFLLRSPDGLVLVDVGIGHLGPPRYQVTGRIDDELRAVGVAHEDVDHVVYTHLHSDHSGGACRPDGTPRFPNARHHVHPDDWAFFGAPRTPPSFTGRFAMAALEELGMLDLDPLDREVAPGVRVAHAPGHTPGHRVVIIDGEEEDVLLLAGDLLHVPPQVVHPEWTSDHDEDPVAACEARARWVEDARSQGWLVAFSHFGVPFGRVEADGWTSI
jgi:glyoxylase-like metal-dependent hydrolase (beta-lactamase superfamily II)